LSTPSALAAYDANVHQEEVDLVVGETYLVYGIALDEGEPGYLVCEEPDDDYPTRQLNCDQRAAGG
jgi:hypothetical protein